MTFPAAFADLESFADWALETLSERTQKRIESPFPNVRALYDALLPRAEAMLAHLDQKPPTAWTEEEKRLHYLSLSLAQVAPAVEFYNDVIVPKGVEFGRFPITSPSHAR